MEPCYCAIAAAGSGNQINYRSYGSTSSARTGLEQSREELSAAFTTELDEVSPRTG